MPSSLTTLTEKVPLLRSFRYPNYRLYWLGMLATTMGIQMRQVAMLWLVYKLTGSPLDLGLVGGVEGIATMVFTLYGGTLADRLDKRRLLMVTNVIFFVLVFLLAIATQAGLVTRSHLLVFAFLLGTIVAFDSPARQALLPHLIGDRRDLMNAIALQSAVHQSSRIIGPALAGLLVATFNVAVSFFIVSTASLAMILAVSRIKLQETDAGQGSGRRPSPLGGVTYVWKNSLFSSIIGMVMVNSLFGMSIIYLMPVFAGDVLKVDARGYGLLVTSMGVGTLTGVLLGAMLGNFKRKHLLLMGGSGLYGLLLVLFAFSRTYGGAAVAIALAGFAQHLYMLTAQTTIQYLVPDKVRGRVMAIYGVMYSLSLLGSLQAGAVASALSTPAAIAIGGGVVTGFTIFLLAFVPRLRKLAM